MSKSKSKVEVKEIIGLDVGQARSGIARASSVAKLAQPLKSVPTPELVRTIWQFSKENELDSVVVGLPRNLQGHDTDQTTWVREWVKRAVTETKLPFYWQDEALTSKLAASQKPKGQKPADEHAVAAAIILQDFLDTPEAERVPC